MEIWRKLYHPLIREGYMISSRGNVKISDELTKGENIYQVLYNASNGYNYCLFTIKTDNKYEFKTRMFPIDDLVAMTFIPVPQHLRDKRIKVRHIDDDTRNSDINNLEWIEDIEEWRVIRYKDIALNYYEISNWGRVRKIESGELCKLHIGSSGYTMVHFRRIDGDNNNRNFRSENIHPIVAMEFVKAVEGATIVNHINGCRNDSYWKNLEYTTLRGNARHAILAGLKKGISDSVLTMIRDMLHKYKYTRIVYSKIDHDKYPYITRDVISAIKAGRYDRVNENNCQPFHPGRLTIDEMDMIRDILIDNDGNCKTTYDMIDHDTYPHITLQIVKEIKTNKYSTYMKSNKYDLSSLKFKRTLAPCRMDDDEIDTVRDILMSKNGSVVETYNVLKSEKPHISIDMISDLKRGKSYRRSNKYDLSESYKYPFKLKE